jgi:hypothetical protein
VWAGDGLKWAGAMPLLGIAVLVAGRRTGVGRWVARQMCLTGGEEFCG